MKIFPSRLAISLLAGFLTLPALAAEPIATVNGTAISAARADAMIAEQRAQGAPKVRNCATRSAKNWCVEKC